MNKTMNKTQFWSDLESGRFAKMVKESAPGQKVSNSTVMYNILKPLVVTHPDVEKIYMVFFNSQNEVLAIEVMFSGSISSASVYPREIIKRVLNLHASAVAMAHNHPSGTVDISNEDKAITLKVAFALDAIGVLLHEHIIIGRDKYHSMADHGEIEKINGIVKDVMDRIN